jgi:hypothetical protein
MGGKGFCTTLCEEQCPAGFACVAVPDPASGVESGFCAKACTSPADCPAGFVCATSSLAADPQAGQCLPSCQSADKDCPAGMQCTAVKACAADAIVGAGLDGGVAPADASGQQPDATHEPADASVEPGDAEVFQGDAEVFSAGDGSIVASADGSVIVSADGSIVAVVDGSIAGRTRVRPSAPDAGGNGLRGCRRSAFRRPVVWLRHRPRRRRAASPSPWSSGSGSPAAAPSPGFEGLRDACGVKAPWRASAPPPSRPASVPPSWTD